MRLHVLVIRSVKRGIEHTARSIVDVVVSAIHNEASETDDHCDSTESEDAKKTDLLAPAKLQAEYDKERKNENCRQVSKQGCINEL